MDKAHFKDGAFCEVCKTAILYLDNFLEKNATKAKIEEAVRKVCSFLPDSVRTQVRCCILMLSSAVHTL